MDGKAIINICHDSNEVIFVSLHSPFCNIASMHIQLHSHFKNFVGILELIRCFIILDMLIWAHNTSSLTSGQNCSVSINQIKWWP